MSTFQKLSAVSPPRPTVAAAMITTMPMRPPFLCLCGHWMQNHAGRAFPRKFESFGTCKENVLILLVEVKDLPPNKQLQPQ